MKHKKYKIMQSDIPIKKCRKCGEEKPATTENYHKDKTGELGFRNECKLCRNNKSDDFKLLQAEKARIYRQNNKEKVKGIVKKYRDKAGLNIIRPVIEPLFINDHPAQKCPKCNEVKLATTDFFYKNTSSKSGLKSCCIDCKKQEFAYKYTNDIEFKNSNNEKSKQYREKNKDKLAEINKEYRKNNRENLKIKKQTYISENLDKVKERSKKYYQSNVQNILENKKKYRENNREKIKESHKNWYSKNKDYYPSLNRASVKIDYTEYRDKVNQRRKTKRNTDLNTKLLDNLRSRVRAALKNQKVIKSSKTIDLIGCDLISLRKHLESQFQEGMSWENNCFEGWHVDHKIPCAAFDLTDPIQQKQCFHYTNLQPMWASDNLSKRDKILEPVQLKMIV